MFVRAKHKRGRGDGAAQDWVAAPPRNRIFGAGSARPSRFCRRTRARVSGRKKHCAPRRATPRPPAPPTPVPMRHRGHGASIGGSGSRGRGQIYAPTRARRAAKTPRRPMPMRPKKESPKKLSHLFRRPPRFGALARGDAQWAERKGKKRVGRGADAVFGFGSMRIFFRLCSHPATGGSVSSVAAALARLNARGVVVGSGGEARPDSDSRRGIGKRFSFFFLRE